VDYNKESLKEVDGIKIINKFKIAIILTSFNRKNKTVSCIKTIMEQAITGNTNIDIELFLCDDCSSDGTKEAIRELFPYVHIVDGTGNLFWSKGMGCAMSEAKKSKPDFYFMVNDDVEFFNNMFSLMIEKYIYERDGLFAVVGSTMDKSTGCITYGGQKWNGKYVHDTYEWVLPKKLEQTCHLANWNCFLIPRRLYDIVGDIDDYYEHSYADYDYSWRMLKKGYKIYVAADYVGICSSNSIVNTWDDKGLSVLKKLKASQKKTGLPIKSRWHYCCKFFGVWAVYRFLRPYFHIVKSGLIYKIKNKGNI
jgi:GT2 family glycosyltransferase